MPLWTLSRGKQLFLSIIIKLNLLTNYLNSLAANIIVVFRSFKEINVSH